MGKISDKYKSLVGKKFNSLTVLEVSSNKKNDNYLLVCKCDCGNIQTIRATRVINGITKTCGCRNKGYSYSKSNKLSCLYPTFYSIWNSMKHRCYDKSNKKYKNYGARGIKICKEWKDSFENFLNWCLNSDYEKGLTLDRIDVNSDYKPNNCRWANFTIQARNKTNNNLVTYNNETKCVAQWCEDLNIPYNTIRARLRLGWTPELAFTTPISKSNKRKKLI